ncbi:hypothetical protein [Wolbachia endosymbiont of Ctenocephalides felis wCfeJ]|uniref:hypothetical protein n=1 Tax=Wolbachia endosymbiont of Ctenocephalides felis wCfeJ TaxID=2732594 RepID=UPI001FE6B8FA|nr:hypothetical protein [Wolbachia endosymbiont of Ctenocephalides felis wCfeJ]WCR57742.1 MAG: hypothetical protein PG980_000214 [Wolbachia endosymbiont of Ctenocephalides felis wCfeJ]
MYSLMLSQYAMLESVKKNQCQSTQLYEHCDLSLPEGCHPTAHEYNCTNTIALGQSPPGRCHPSVRALGSSFSCNLVKDVCFSIKQLLLCLPSQCAYLQSNFWIPVLGTGMTPEINVMSLFYCNTRSSVLAILMTSLVAQFNSKINIC